MAEQNCIIIQKFLFFSLYKNKGNSDVKSEGAVKKVPETDRDLTC